MTPHTAATAVQNGHHLVLKSASGGVPMRGGPASAITSRGSTSNGPFRATEIGSVKKLQSSRPAGHATCCTR